MQRREMLIESVPPALLGQYVLAMLRKASSRLLSLRREREQGMALFSLPAWEVGQQILRQAGPLREEGQSLAGEWRQVGSH